MAVAGNRATLVSDGALAGSVTNLMDCMRTAVKEIVESFDGSVSMHDFRTVIGPTHTNMIFDVLVPFDYPMTDAQVKEKVQAEVWERLGKEYYTVIQIDRPYTAMKK